MWLASLSRRNRFGKIWATQHWRHEFEWAYGLLCEVLFGLGDPRFERLFRMNVTLCLHRAATDAEIQCFARPLSASEEPALAGGPVESLWARGFRPSLSCLPCAEPTRHLLDSSRPDLWAPIDCGRCPSCLDRKRIAHAPDPGVFPALDALCCQEGA